MSILIGFYSPKEEAGVDKILHSHIQSCMGEDGKITPAATIPGLVKYTVGRVAEVAKETTLFTNYSLHYKAGAL